MRGIFTREERVVVLFLAVSLLVGSAVVRAGRMFPSAIPDFGGVSGQLGPVRASEIVRRRELTGGYSTLEELLEIKGIGPVTLDGLRDKATVGGGVALPADSGRVTDAR